MDAVNRPEDDELCGFVDGRPDGWHALTVFGASLGIHPTRTAAEKHVVNDGLASLMERWILSDGSTEEIVCIQEARPNEITVVVGYYALPGVPTMRIDRTELDARRWTLRLDRWHRGPPARAGQGVRLTTVDNHGMLTS